MRGEDRKQQLKTRRIAYSWEVGTVAGVTGQGQIEVPIDTPEYEINDIVSDAVHNESGFGWGWDDA